MYKGKKNKKIKICIINPNGYRLYNNTAKVPFGGAEVQLFLLSREFAKRPNLDINVVLGINDFKKKGVLIWNRIKLFITLPLNRATINYILRPLNLFLTLFKIKPDIIIQRGAGVYTGMCAIYGKLFRKIFIYSIANQPDVNGKFASERIVGKIYEFGLLNSNFIIAQHSKQIKLLKSWKPKKNLNIKIIRTGYKIQRVDVKKKKNIIWVGRAVFWKKPEFFILLAKKFYNEDFIIICNKGKNKSYFNNIKKLSKNLRNLKFIEFVPFDNIDKYFKEAKILVNTSLYEGFPNTFIQAFKNKTPVISLNVNPGHIITRFKLGFLCENNFEKMVCALKNLLNDHKLYDSYSKNTFSYAKNYHNIKKTSEKWINLIFNLFIKYKK